MHATEVRLVQNGDQYALLRDGEPYVIKGAGGSERLEELAACGGNSIRTWGTDNLEPLLDRAHALGLTVTVGIWLGHPRHGFDYTNDQQVSRQLVAAESAIVRYRNHPALLMWGVGNEMEEDGSNPAIWYAVNHIARRARELDPNHPTITIIAELGGRKVANLHRFCPDVDVVGINSYGGLSSVGQRYREAGGSKPYVVTEFGPPGQWETGKTAWGAPLEMTSTAKAEWYSNGYRDGIAAHPGLCLGSYAFVWGAKQEATATWFGMFLRQGDGLGDRLGAVEAMRQAWGGPAPANRCPTIAELALTGSASAPPGTEVTAAVVTEDPDGDPLQLRWVLRRESGLYATGGDAQAEQPEYPEAIMATDGRTATVRLPESGGSYRLFVYVHDGQGNAAVANLPLQVDGPVLPVPAPSGRLPYQIYAEGADESAYACSGYMGETAAITMDFRCTETPHDGDHCIRVDYAKADGWGGVVWQSPPNDWGDQPGGFDFTGATELEFYVRGARGGEVVSFHVGMIGPDKPYPDTAQAELKAVRLRADWQRLRVPLDGRDLSRIKSGFAWVLAGQGQPVTFYLDDIRFVGGD